ncbi:3-oxoacyl-[acyl-carrier-protein] synthase 3 [Bacteroidia bacterium]|nr:3-oxoacyl-[acyl-carrier-protein] synthase 3 [Bacteroidia bacterium]
MYINAVGNYIPEMRVPNAHFLAVNGLSDEWIYQRTGILTRSKAAAHENTNTMGIEAVKDVSRRALTYDIDEVDLIVGATYSPYDTVHTLAHAVQHKFNIKNAQAVCITSACSSFVNALEIVQGYFAMSKAKTALIVASEHNTAYADESNAQAGHLWGDAAVAVFLSKERCRSNDAKIIDIYTRGMGHIGKANEAVTLRPFEGGIQMPEGKDVFFNACKYMQQALEVVLQRNNITIANLSYMVGHQANGRIISAVAKQMQIPDEKILTNISELGNTGAPSNMLVISQNMKRFKRGDLVGITVFGGGYSCGAYLIRF